MAEESRDSGSTGPRAPDDYEAKYMALEDALYRDKIKVPKKFFLLFLLPVAIQAFTFSAVALQGKPMPLSVFLILPFTALMMALISLLFAVLRITVTRTEVLVQYGLFGPKIPVAQIRECKAIAYNWMDYGGWGIRRGRDGSWAYNMVGDAGRAVRIEWLNAKGKKEVTLLASPNPDSLARAVNEARGMASGKRRIAADPRLAEFEAEAEAEAEAVLLDEEKKRGEAG